MILQEAIIGGTIYLDYVESEMALPESERVAFDYGPIPNRVRVDLLHRTSNGNGAPNGLEVCRAAIDGNNKKIKNLFGEKKEVLDTVEKVLAYPDKDMVLAYMLEIVGMKIWRKQVGEDVDLKN